MPAKNGRGLDEQGCFTPSWRDSRGENDREALPRSPSEADKNLPLCDDELLSKKRILRDQFDATANEIRGQPGNEPKKDRSRVESYTVHAQMEFVARTAVERALIRRFRGIDHRSDIQLPSPRGVCHLWSG